MFRYLFLVCCLVVCAALPAQSYIGMNKTEIRKLMTEQHHSFDLDEGAKNTTYKYLKYVDK